MLTLLAAGLLAAVLLAPSASAAKPVSSLRVSPASPTLETPITVTWRAGARAPASGRYTVRLTTGPASSTKLVCTHLTSKTGLRRNAEGIVTATFRPTGRDVETRKWCLGTSVASISRRSGAATQVLARRTFAVHRGKGELAPGLVDTPASVRLLAGSTITLSAPGHADRTSPVNGELRGFIPSPFRLGQDIHITRARGALVPVSLGADPLCPAVVPPRAIQVDRASALTVFADGRVSLTMRLMPGAAQIIGCGAAAPASPATTITATGKVAARGLLALNLDGAAAGITLKLLVFVDLSDPV